MFSNRRIMTSIENSSDNMQRSHELCRAVKMADRVVREMMGL